MRLALAAALAAAALPAHAHSFRGIRGDGSISAEERHVPPFQAIRLEAPADVTVKVGPPRSVAVKTDGNLQRLLVTDVEDGVLVIEAADSMRPSELRVEVTVPELRRLVVAGSGDVAVEGGSGPVALAVEGSGDLRWRGEATALDAEVRGSGDLRLEGRAASLRAVVEGSGDIHAAGLAATDAEARVDGSGDIELRVAGGKLEAAVAGSGDVRWRGEARVESVVVRGSGDVTRKD